MRKIIEARPAQAENLKHLQDEVQKAKTIFVAALNAVIVGEVEGDVTLVSISPDGKITVDVKEEIKES